MMKGYFFGTLYKRADGRIEFWGSDGEREIRKLVDWEDIGGEWQHRMRETPDWQHLGPVLHREGKEGQP